MGQGRTQQRLSKVAGVLPAQSRSGETLGPCQSQEGGLQPGFPASPAARVQISAVCPIGCRGLGEAGRCPRGEDKGGLLRSLRCDLTHRCLWL